MRLLALLLTCSSLCGADEVPGFAPAPRTGPLAEILNPIVRPAPVSSGLAFALPVLRDGRLASDGRFTLPVSRTGAGLKLRFDSLVLKEDGALEGIVRLRNESGLPVYGLRLDFTARASLGSPLWLGDLEPGAEATPVAFRTSPVVRDPAADVSVVMGAVAGVAFLGEEPVAPMTARPRSVRAPQRPLPPSTPAPGPTTCVLPSGHPRDGSLGAPETSAECRAAGELRYVLERSPPRVQVFEGDFRFVTAFGRGLIPPQATLETRAERDVIVKGAVDTPALRFRFF